jgi:hypothetical protein
MASIKLSGHRNRIFSVFTITLADGTPVVVSGSADNTIKVYMYYM